jgi:probable rRNA maturation factor
MIAVNVNQDFEDLKVSIPSLKTLVRAVCRRFGVSKAVVGVAIVGDPSMRQLNRRFMGRRGTTDCFSFDLSETSDRADKRVFEIVVNAEKALREARHRGHRPQAELALYVTHALLHQLGFDDTAPSKARRMHRMEDEILQELGYGIIYHNRRKEPCSSRIGPSASVRSITRRPPRS